MKLEHTIFGERICELSSSQRSQKGRINVFLVGWITDLVKRSVPNGSVLQPSESVAEV